MENNKGFTLLEALIVVAIISTMAVIATTMILGKAPDYKLRGTAREVYSALQRARSVAVKRNGSARIEFDSVNNSYELCDDWDGSNCVGSTQVTDLSSVGLGVGFGHGNASADITGGSFPADNVSYVSNRAVFNANGTGNAGYIYLDHRDSSTTYAVGGTSSGSIRIFKWNGGAWE